ncbi:diguanylate cyclase [Dyella sp.]|jgi:diguanylate cyclase (GGDEF)-like protein|uniref:sensor domain-containing diguanylate cyclase n=1 Tax=Dyella sp. TaxID=1869338 RepID=UPI002D78466D|nr:diguanylate cyclase [Dyella sp.]HET6432408.1 diguanylate cyclase [Dyella sp.]
MHWPGSGHRQRNRLMARALCLLMLLWIGTVHAAMPMSGAWRDVRDGDTPAQVLAEYRQNALQRFDPDLLRRFPHGPLGTWIVLAPQPPWVEEARVLSVYPPPVGTVTLYDQNGPKVSLALDDFRAAVHGHGRLAFLLRTEVPASAPILLKFEPSARAAAPVAFRLQNWSHYLQRDSHWLVFATASLTVLLAMALMTLCFSVLLRDVTFAWYAGYVLCYALMQGIQTGFVYHPLEMDWLSGLSTTVNTAAVALSVAFASMFMIRFCELQRYAPLLRVPVLALAVGMVAVVLMRCSQWPPLENVGQLLVNPLLTLGTVLLLVASVLAAARGSRHAWFFLAGWTPLLALTAMRSAQISGALAALDWLNDAGLVVGAFEAIVLSFGLADRALMIRRDRDEVRVLADRDSLTQVFNRRAWSEAAIQAMSDPARPQSLLFLDLDYFKRLNDRLGHAAGDHALVAVADALRQELRPVDLLGRYGGEEFVALLDGAGEAESMQIATRLCRRVNRLEIPVDGENLMLSVSIGVGIRRSDDSIDSLIARADQAMYAAKLAGRNRVCLEPRPGQPEAPPRPGSVARTPRRSS